jgi:hypothetical protein
MKRVHMGPLLILTLLMTLLSSSGLAPDAMAVSKSDRTDGSTLRVGIYESRAIALAFGRSELNMSRVRELKQKHRQAEAEGNEEAKVECETLGPRWQELLHRQVFGDAPIPDILAILEPRMAEVREASGVDLIVTGVVATGDNIEVVDVTQEMMALFDLDEDSIKMANEIKSHPPIPWFEFPLEGE